MSDRTERKLTWIRDLPDHRDYMFAASPEALRTLPQKVDLRAKCPPVYDQGRIGSCTANAIAGAIQFDRQNAKSMPDFVPSRLFIYYNERVIEHTVPLDNGAMLRDGIKSVVKSGVCPEASWPYDDTPADRDTNVFPPMAADASKPPVECYTEAQKYKVSEYRRLQQNLTQLKGCLAQGNPFVFGFTVYDSFFDQAGNQQVKTPLPGAGEAKQGGHAVAAVGYDDAENLFIVRNSWGPGVVDKGYYYMPYAYLTDGGLAADFWMISKLSN